MSAPVFVILVDHPPKPPRSKLARLLDVVGAIVALSMIVLAPPRRRF